MWRRLRLAGSAVPPARRVATYPRLAVAARAEGDAGSAASRRLRAAGRVPCAVYGVGSDGRRDRVLGSVCARDLWRELRARRETVENTVYEVSVDGGAPELALPRQVQLRAASDDVLSVNFLRFAPGARVTVPLRFVGASSNPLLKRGGYLHRVAHGLRCVCGGADIPSHVDVSVAAGGKNHVFRARDADLPPGLEFRGDGDAPLAVIKTK